jgi:hypothetical protein
MILFCKSTPAAIPILVISAMKIISFLRFKKKTTAQLYNCLDYLAS